MCCHERWPRLVGPRRAQTVSLLQVGVACRHGGRGRPARPSLRARGAACTMLNAVSCAFASKPVCLAAEYGALPRGGVTAWCGSSNKWLPGLLQGINTRTAQRGQLRNPFPTFLRIITDTASKRVLRLRSENMAPLCVLAHSPCWLQCCECLRALSGPGHMAAHRKRRLRTAVKAVRPRRASFCSHTALSVCGSH